jgi:glutaredoxin
MRAFVIAAAMTALVAGLGLVLAPEPAPRGPIAAEGAAGRVETGPRAGSEALRAADGPDRGATGSGKSVFYQWTDDRGVVRFARSLGEVPAAWRERAGQIEVDADAFRPKTAPARAAARAPAAETQPRFHDVTVYTAPWCGWCRKTLAWLDAREIEYVNKDIEADADHAAELVEKSGGRAIPFVEIDGTQIRGFNPRQMSALLE